VTEETQHLQKRLEREGEKVCAYFESLPPTAWEQAVYTTGSAWRVREVLAHFITAERGYLHYMRDTLDGGPGVPKDFDIDAFNEAQVPTLDALSNLELVEALRSVRRETVSFVGSLGPGDLDREGFHPWFGQGTLGFIIKLIYRHPMLHLRDTRQAIETGQPVPHGEGYVSFAGDGPRTGE
jgi:hypothetical protein